MDINYLAHSHYRTAVARPLPARKSNIRVSDGVQITLIGGCTPSNTSVPVYIQRDVTEENAPGNLREPWYLKAFVPL